MGSVYVYGVVSADADPGLFESEAGLEGQGVSLVASGAVAALCSDLAGGRARGTRANLSAHQRVVEAARRVGTVLPVRFGTVLPHDGAVVEDFLAPYAPQLESALRELTGKREFRLKAVYLTDVTIREAIIRDPRLRRARKALAARGGGTYNERIGLGELVAQGLDRIKMADRDSVLGRLQRLGVPLRPLDADGPEVAVHVAALVDDTDQTRFEETVERLAREEAERLRFELVGPLAPWDYVDLHPIDHHPSGRRRARLGA